MEYYFNNLNPTQFQRLINTILTARFGEDTRLTPLRGKDGGRDGETAPNNPNFEYQVKSITPTNPAIVPPKPGRYLFQVKHHSTIDTRISDARQSVISDFKSEFRRNVISRTGDERVNYFFLITNVPSSRDSLIKLDQIRLKLLEGYENLHTDVWWQEQLIAFLDQMPNIWSSFPDLFAGGKIPFITSVVADDSAQLPRAVKLAISKQYQRDGKIKFRQINLQTDLSKLFTDLDATLEELDSAKKSLFLNAEMRRLKQVSILHSSSGTAIDNELEFEYQLRMRRRDRSVSALGALLLEGEVSLDEKERENPAKKLILEGGPGQGKSTITQMTAQIYREQILKKTYMDPEGRWIAPQKNRIPFRIELRVFAEEITQKPEFSVEQFIALNISKDSGGTTVNVDDIHTIVEGSPILLIFDGLDEVGSDDLRDETISKILECVDRFENDLSSDLRVIITTRPPAISGRRERFSGFSRLRIASLNEERINSYLGRWLSVQLHDDEDERSRVADSFNKRRHEYLIEPLVRNPMQLSVLLHFIHIQGDAFPDRRAELYKEYFETVIKRDVEKSPQLRERRRTVEALHQYLAYKIHALTENQQIDGSLSRDRLLDLASNWLNLTGHSTEKAENLFKLGEDRLGLIVILRGEGKEAKYGYEIQPIQEYFAAAYIDEQVEGDATEIFAAMVRRPFWREVALFLAGLRKPKEKADLLIRAKSLDDDEVGWRQDGRTITLQLLQEGAFSEPKYVFTEALKFVLEALDYRKVRFQNEPEDLVQKLIAILRQEDSRQVYPVIMKLIQDFQTCNDEYAIYRLYAIASRVLEADFVVKSILYHRSQSSNLLTKLRLSWAYHWNLDMRDESRNASFWEGASSYFWSDSWWSEAISNSKATNVLAPSELHQKLVVQFAMSTLEDLLPRDTEFIKPLSNWAVWKLLSYVQILGFSFNFREDTILSKVRQEIHSIPNLNDLDFSGLDESVSKTMRYLLDLYSKLLNSIIEESSESFLQILHENTADLLTHLRYEGLPSLVTLQSVRVLLSSVFGRRKYRLVFPESILNNENLRILLTEVVGFYRGRTNIENFSEEKILSLFSQYHPLYFHENISFIKSPKYIRVGEDGKLKSLVEILSDKVINQIEPPFSWIEDISYSTEIVKSLVEKCSNHSDSALQDLMTLLGGLHFSRIGNGRPLTVQNINRILKVARSTDDPLILSGISVALSTSRFLKSAGCELISKLLEFTEDSKSLDRMLFQLHSNFPDSLEGRELEIIEDLADLIMRNSPIYSMRINCAAAKFLSERRRIKLQPLLMQESSLGLEVRVAN